MTDHRMWWPPRGSDISEMQCELRNRDVQVPSLSKAGEIMLPSFPSVPKLLSVLLTFEIVLNEAPTTSGESEETGSVELRKLSSPV